MNRINIELSEFDVKLILDILEEQYYNSRKDTMVEAEWVRQEDNSYIFIPKHSDYVDTKKSKQIKSTMSFIKKQLENYVSD